MVIDRRRPGPGARHLLKVEDIKTFTSLIPEWQELSKGVDAIALLPYDDWTYGSYNLRGVIKIRAWPSKLWIEMYEDTEDRRAGSSNN